MPGTYAYKKIMFELQLGKIKKPNGNCPVCHNGDVVPSQTATNYSTIYTLVCGCCCLWKLYTADSWGIQNRCHYCGYVPEGQGGC
jgi:hypothetical protein